MFLYIVFVQAVLSCESFTSQLRLKHQQKADVSLYKHLGVKLIWTPDGCLSPSMAETI